MITTSRSDSMPSISEQNIGTSVLVMLNDRMARRVPRMDSASSMKMKGSIPACRRARAWAKRSRTMRSDSPSHMFRISGPFTWRKVPPVMAGCSAVAVLSASDAPTSFARLAAAAWPMSVLPQPGGP